MPSVVRPVSPPPVDPLPIDNDGGQALRAVIDRVTWGPFHSTNPERLRPLLHQVFELVLRQRVERLSRAGSENQTDAAVAELMVQSAGDELGVVLDPACGMGSALLTASHRPHTILAGRDINRNTVARARMRFDLAGVEAHLDVGDSFSMPTHGHFDTVLLDPSWGMPIPTDGPAEFLELRFGPVSPRAADWLGRSSRTCASTPEVGPSSSSPRERFHAAPNWRPGWRW